MTASRVALIVTALVVLTAVTATAASASRYVEPAFTVIREYDGFEIREYAPTVQARVLVRDESRAGLSDGFRALAGYIFGGNDREQSIVPFVHDVRDLGARRENQARRLGGDRQPAHERLGCDDLLHAGDADVVCQILHLNAVGISNWVRILPHGRGRRTG